MTRPRAGRGGHTGNHDGRAHAMDQSGGERFRVES